MSIVGEMYEEEFFDMNLRIEKMKDLLEDCYWTLSNNEIKRSDPIELALRIDKFLKDDRTRI